MLITDLRLQDAEGLELVREARARPVPPLCIGMSGYATIEEAARLMHDSDVSGLPVLKEGRLVGLINRTMMLAAFI